MIDKRLKEVRIIQNGLNTKYIKRTAWYDRLLRRKSLKKVIDNRYTVYYSSYVFCSKCGRVGGYIVYDTNISSIWDFSICSTCSKVTKNTMNERRGKNNA